MLSTSIYTLYMIGVGTFIYFAFNPSRWDVSKTLIEADCE